MRSTVAPSRTSRPRSANGSMRKGWIRSSGFGSCSTGNKETPAFDYRKMSLRAQRSNLVPTRVPPDRDCFVASLLAMTSRGLRQAPREDAPLDMQPVFRLVPDDRLRAVDDPRRDLLAALHG